MRTGQQYRTREDLHNKCNNLNTQRNRVNMKMKIMAKKRAYEGLTPLELEEYQRLNEQLLELKIEEAHVCYLKNMI
jgi:hypothetical protein